MGYCRYTPCGILQIHSRWETEDTPQVGYCGYTPGGRLRIYPRRKLHSAMQFPLSLPTPFLVPRSFRIVCTAEPPDFRSSQGQWLRAEALALLPWVHVPPPAPADARQLVHATVRGRSSCLEGIPAIPDAPPVVTDMMPLPIDMTPMIRDMMSSLIPTTIPVKSALTPVRSQAEASAQPLVVPAGGVYQLVHGRIQLAHLGRNEITCGSLIKKFHSQVSAHPIVLMPRVNQSDELMIILLHNREHIYTTLLLTDIESYFMFIKNTTAREFRLMQLLIVLRLVVAFRQLEKVLCQVQDNKELRKHWSGSCEGGMECWEDFGQCQASFHQYPRSFNKYPAMGHPFMSSALLLSKKKEPKLVQDIRDVLQEIANMLKEVKHVAKALKVATHETMWQFRHRMKEHWGKGGRR